MSYFRWKFEDPKDGTYNVADLTGNGNNLVRVDANGTNQETKWSNDSSPMGLSKGSIELHHTNSMCPT